MSRLRVCKWKEFILELENSPFLTSTEGSFVMIDAVLSFLRSVFDTRTMRVLLLCLRNQFLLLLVNTVLSFTVNKETAAIDESSFSVSCRAAGSRLRDALGSPQHTPAWQLPDSPVPALEVLPAWRDALVYARPRTDVTLLVHYRFQTPFFISYVFGTISQRGEVLFFKSFGVCECWSHGSRSPVGSTLIHS